MRQKKRNCKKNWILLELYTSQGNTGEKINIHATEINLPDKLHVWYSREGRATISTKLMEHAWLGAASCPFLDTAGSSKRVREL